MGEISIPIPNVKDGQKAEITVNLPEQEHAVSYRVEMYAFKLMHNTSEISRSEQLFQSLKDRIEHYDSNWELLQVYAPEEGDDNKIKVLYRKR